MTLHVGPIRHVGLFTPNLKNHSRFYSEIWGLELVSETSDAVFFRGASAEYFLLSLHNGRGKGLHHLAYELTDDEAVRDAASILKQAGVRIIHEPDSLDEPGGGLGFRFVDPDGRCIELSSRVARHSNSWRRKSIDPQSVCHVVLNTPDIGRITDFYTKVLGFRISDWSGQQMVFLRTDSKHHNISFNAAPHASVNHVAFLVPNVDGVMSSVSHMRQQGFEPEWGPGRHGPGNNIFCYYKDPLGYVVEYTSDIDYISDDAHHQPKVWQRGPESMDRWGIAAPPTPELREAMTGEADQGWAA